MITESPSMNRRGNKVMSESEHFKKRGIPCFICKVIGIHPFGECRAGRWFNTDDIHILMPAGKLVSCKWERDAGEVGSPANTSNHHIRVIINHCKLLAAFKADHRLMQAYMV